MVREKVGSRRVFRRVYQNQRPGSSAARRARLPARPRLLSPSSSPQYTPLLSPQLLCPFHTIPTFLVTFSYSFAAGDVVLILPSNSEAHTQQFCQVLCLDPNQFFTLKPREPGEYGRHALALRSKVPPNDPTHQASMPFLQVSLTHQGCLSPALCGTLCHSTWILPACPAVPSLSSWLVSPHMRWSGRSCWNSALPEVKKSSGNTVIGPAEPSWRWACG